MQFYYRPSQEAQSGRAPVHIRQDHHTVASAFTFLLLLIFMMFTLLLAATGSAIYRNGVVYLNENYTTRTAVAYVAEKIRQHDESGCVFLTEVEGLPALALREEINDVNYLTYIYYYDGALRELFVREDREALASMGSEIVELAALTIEETAPESDSAEETGGSATANSAGMLMITAVSDEGNELSMLIQCRSQ